jgi:GH25 family lysozyme M1 (1,4-beta-N-acetylmuramidase)
MVSWIRDFLNSYKARTTRDAVIYTNLDCWTRCTGNSTAFNATNPLWVARYASAPGTLPEGWPFHTIWQYISTPIDQNRFNGDQTRLVALANG